MHVHLPKALHGWRELAREIGIIVVGVLIALFFDQMVERWEWAHKVAAAEAAMKHELLWDDGPQLYQRAALYPCMAARLDAIRVAVDRNRSRAEIWKAIDGYWTSYLTYDSMAHEAAQSSDVSSHISKSELEPYDFAYSVMPTVNRDGDDEVRDWAKMRAFRRTGGPLSDVESTQVLGAVGALQDLNVGMRAGAAWTLPQLRKLGTLDPTRVQHFMATARTHYGACVKDLQPTWPD